MGLLGTLAAGAVGGAAVTIVISAVDNFSRTFTKAETGMTNLAIAGGAMVLGGAAIAGGIALAVKSYIDLETAMVGVRKTTGMTAEETEVLEKAIVDLSQEMPVAATKLAGIAEVAGQLGIQGTEDILKFTETVAQMAIATELTEEDAALALAKISNIFGRPITDVDKLGSAINELSNTTAASSSGIVSAVVRVGGSAASLGVLEETVLGMSATLIAMGEAPERAGTKLRSAFDQIIKKVDEASEFMGIDFKKALEEDANGAIMSLIQKLSEIESPVERQQTAMELFGTVGASAITKLTGNMPDLITNIGAASEQLKTGVSLQEEYDVAADSTASHLDLLKNNFMAISIELGKVFIPLLRDYLIPFLKKLTDFWDNLSEGQKKAIGIVLGIAAALLILTGIVLLVTAATAAFTLTNLWWIIGIAAAIAIGYLLIKNWDKIKVAVAKLGVIIKNVFIGIRNVVVGVWNGIVSIIEGSINTIIKGINILIKAMNLIPGVNIKTIGEVDFGRYKAAMMEYAIYTPPTPAPIETPTSTTQSEALIAGAELAAEKAGTTININNLNGFNARDIADTLQEELNKKI